MRFAIIAMCMALAQSAFAQDLKTCAALADDAERVKCYDKLAGRDPAEAISEFAAQCEMKLIQRLVSPSGYHRVGIEETSIPMTIDQYVDEEFIAIRDRNLKTPEIAVIERAQVRNEEARLRSEGGTVNRHRVVITYDAPNRANAVLRDYETCTEVKPSK